MNDPCIHWLGWAHDEDIWHMSSDACTLYQADMSWVTGYALAGRYNELLPFRECCSLSSLV